MATIAYQARALIMIATHITRSGAALNGRTMSSLIGSADIRKMEFVRSIHIISSCTKITAAVSVAGQALRSPATNILRLAGIKSHGAQGGRIY